MKNLRFVFLDAADLSLSHFFFPIGSASHLIIGEVNNWDEEDQIIFSFLPRKTA